jgi:D-arabinose 5-phosphate isomerase GutQ
MSFIMTLASTGTTQVFVSMALAANSTTPPTYNFFNITVVGLS